MERKFEIAARMLQVRDLTYSREWEWTLGGNHQGRMFVNCTHIIVSLLKAWKVTMVGIECDDAAF